MALSKQKKVEVVSALEKVFSGANSAVFVKFGNFPVQITNQFRRRLQKEGVGYTVAKKTLIKRSLSDQKIEGSLPELPGQIGVAYGDDLLSPAREVFGFGQENKGMLEIVGGIFDGNYKNAQEMMSIATIPSMQGLRGMFVNIINSPIQRMVIALNEIAKTKN